VTAAGARPGAAVALVVAGLAGFAVMSLELVAVRLLAPWFGDSAYVWTNVIGVLLVALAAGAWLGGLFARPDRAAPRLVVALGLAAFWAVGMPFVAGFVADFMVVDAIPLDAAMPALVRGSLAATLVLFAPPAVLLGAVSPLLITTQCAARTDDGAPVAVGPVVGRIAAVSTFGSLLGTFLTTHLLVPGLGSRATVWVAAALLGIATLLAGGGGVLSRARARTVAVVVLGALACAAGASPFRSLRGAPPGQVVRAEVESAYQFLQVVEDEDGTRRLRINEGLDSFHSIKRPDTPWTEGAYYDWYPPLALLVPDWFEHGVLSLGSAAGTFERVFRAGFGDGVAFDSVEIDPTVVALGREWFDAYAPERPGSVYAGLDARVFVERARGRRYGLVLVDAYERQIYVPAHVASTEFFTAVRERLVEGGLVCVNVGGVRFDDPVVRTIAATAASVFGGTAHAFRVPFSRNFVVVARRGGRLEDPHAVLASAAEGLGAGSVLKAQAEAMSRASDWRRYGPEDGSLLRDDRPFLDELQERSLAPDAADAAATVVACSGDRSVDLVESDVREAYEAGRFEHALDLAASAERDSGYLRFLLGRVRWRLRDLAGARAEYAAIPGAAVALPDGFDEYVRADRQLLDEELDGPRRARELARSNGWLATFAAVLLAFATLIAARRAAVAS
jgi:spermidine synthase